MNFQKGYTPHNKGVKKWFVPDSEINRSEWTDSELDFIKENLLKMSNAELAFHLKRTISQVKRKLERHILRRGKSFIPQTLRKDYDPTKRKIEKKKKKRVVKPKITRVKKEKEIKLKERIIFSRVIEKSKKIELVKEKESIITKKKQIPIYIDRRTTVYVDCESKIEEVRNKYLIINQSKVGNNLNLK